MDRLHLVDSLMEQRREGRKEKGKVAGPGCFFSFLGKSGYVSHQPDQSSRNDQRIIAWGLGYQ